ncbi:methyltransferase family protein [Desulfomicrobium escambiense]|uniref:methyltransferase family protein n=1 Tax=Desulfomicrobium escambiense TaxID=29503 RepID=UPI000407BD01|nr:methyltransferase [Desulfomicrobium escambiense]
MSSKSVSSKILGPGYGVIVAGCVVENFIIRTQWFKLGSVIGLLWMAVGLAALFFALRELRKGEGYMLVETGLYAVSRNPIMAANLLGVMPGLCLILNTNIGILGIALAAYSFFSTVGAEETALEDEFGEAYQVYRERVSLLVPVPFGGGA